MTIQQTIDWLSDGARSVNGPVEVLRELCDRITAAGLDIARAAVYVETLHPTVFGRRFIWEQGKETVVDEASFAFAETEMYRATPIRRVYDTGQPLRRELHLDSCPDDFPAVSEFRDLGMTDYLALPLHFINGEVHAVSWLTMKSNGFTEEEVDDLTRISVALSRVAEIYALRRVAGNLLDAYVGQRSGAQILAGQIRRGDTEEIEAAIWLSDLRGFTSMADALSGTELIETINSHFDCLVPAVREFGGEVLKFMGDGMLAIFPVENKRNRKLAAHSALNAALAARANMAELNRHRASDNLSPLSFGLALNIGDIHYGNIGAEDRLDFTAIGPAVNLAARMESVAAQHQRDIVVSSAFQSHLDIDNELMGQFEIKGFSQPVEIYAVPVNASTAAGK